MKSEFESTSSRRQFLQTSTIATVGGLAMPFILPGSSRGAEINSDTIKVGLVGCGGRGRGAAGQAMAADKNVVLTAIGDAFEEPLKSCLDTLQKEETAKDKLKVETDRMFVGLDAFQKVIESGVDVVLLASPPGFRPQHLAAAIKAGKHVFCEKPVATDAPGVRSVLASAEEAKRKKLSLVSGFCWRYDFARRALYEEIHQGRVGDIRAIYGTFYTGPVKPMPPASTRNPEWSDLEWQVRNWYNFGWLSGDGLVEQAVHSVDKMAWAMKDVPPLKAVAVGGRQVPAEGGNIYDHFEVNYEYANGTRGFLGCRQQPFCYSQNADYILATKGVATIGVKPTPEITGENPWRFRGEKNQNMYQTEHDELFASIRAGKAHNDGTWMSHSTLMAIMGRMAAYTGQEITWEQALNSQEVLVPANLKWNDSLAVTPMAIPGKTKFI